MRFKQGRIQWGGGRAPVPPGVLREGPGGPLFSYKITKTAYKTRLKYIKIALFFFNLALVPSAFFQRGGGADSPEPNFFSDAPNSCPCGDILYPPLVLRLIMAYVHGR